MKVEDKIELTPNTIDELMGCVGADEEDGTRLKAFFFKSVAYEQLKSKYPFHIVIGRKGTGKTAMIRYVGFEDEHSGRLVIDLDFARSDLVNNIPKDYNSVIRFWKEEFEKALCNAVSVRLEEDAPGVKVPKCVAWSVLRLELKKLLVGNPLIGRSAECTGGEIRVGRYVQAAKSNTLTVNIDNLDRAWRIDKKSMIAMAAMMDSFRELIVSHKGLRINIALRTDMFYQLLPAQESTDKLASARVFLDWTNHEILAMLAKRVVSYLKIDKYTDRALNNMSQLELMSLVSPLIAQRFDGAGAWSNEPMNHIILSLVRRRPRDMVNLLKDAALVAYKKRHSRIESEDVQGVMSQYSQGCLIEICNEYGNEIENLKELLMRVPRTRKERALISKDQSVFKTSDLNARLKRIRADAKLYFKGRFAPVTPDELRCFLFRIGFLTARTNFGGVPEWRFYEDAWILGDGQYDAGMDWEIHPAYRFAIGDNVIS